ncbi:MAG: hypothetical protein IPJ46_09410 [Anaerolineales bacterium]|nr:hypothetical protein [Anaerolineales bacterium]
MEFRPCGIQGDAPFPAVEHYFALDQETGILVLCARITVSSRVKNLSKNLHLPLEEMLLQNVREKDSSSGTCKKVQNCLFSPSA